MCRHASGSLIDFRIRIVLIPAILCAKCFMHVYKKILNVPKHYVRGNMQNV